MPADREDLVEWADSRLLIPVDEWDILIEAIDGDHRISPDETAAGVSSRCFFVMLPGACVECVTSVYAFSLLCEAFDLAPAQGLTRVFPGANAAALVDMVETLTAKRASVDTREPVSPERIVGQWLGYYGPVSVELPLSVFGKSAINSGETLPRLVEEEGAVIGRFTKGAAKDEICDVENLEKLLIFSRRRRRRGFEPLPTGELISFLSSWQGAGGKGSGPDALKQALTPLLCLPASAGAWEKEIIPARVENYQTGWLDELLRTTDLEWTGSGEGRIAFCFPEDSELTEPALKAHGSSSFCTETGKIFPDRLGRYSFWDLQEFSGLTSFDLTKLLWNFVWKGVVRCDSYEIVRNGILQGFKPPERPELRPKGGGRTRRRFDSLAQWKASRPVAGNWYLAQDCLGDEEYDRDPIDEMELDRDRVRLLLARYGVIFRELLAKEAQPLRWGRLFRTMRLMELAGEITGGYFFDGVPGVQFALPAGLRMLGEKKTHSQIFLLNAADPASLCGVDLPALKELLPERFSSTYVVYHGNRAVIVARKHGEELEIALPPGDASLPDYITELRSLTRRSFQPLKTIKVRRINGRNAAGSEYGPALERCGFLRDYRGYTLWAV